MYRDYRVQKGDHLNAIARDLETTREILVEANHLKNPDALVPGEHLKVPVQKAYVVQSGDTMAAVAKRFDVGVRDLADLNDLPERTRLRAGDELALPAVIHDTGPVLLASSRTVSRYTPSRVYQPSPWATNVAEGRGANSADGHMAPLYASPTAMPTPTLTDAQVTAAGRGRFVWPVRGDVLSGFGVKDVGRRNDGVDLKAVQGTPVHAAAAGDVVYAGDQVPGFGNLVLIKHADGWVTAYAHLDKINVKMRDNVTQDQEIGQVGESGGVSEPQLHFEIRYAPTPMAKATPIDPLLVLPQ
jgi:murein DD-endopeptidase MepM/ murein hydrolase activator NlpD